MSLDVFFDPASVAVVGASADPAKWGYWLARGALRGAGRRRVDLVNRHAATIDGYTSYRSLTELPEPPELVVLCVPAATVPQVIAEGIELGVQGFLGVTAGVPDEQGLAATVRAAGARIVGPNCLGLYDASTELELAWGTFMPGCVGIVSQSGQLGLEIAGLAAQAGLGVSRFVSVGNQIDVTAAEAIDDLAGHQATRAVVVYLESFTDGRGLVGTLARLSAAGKPVILLTVGGSEASRAAARSHTGALTVAADVVDAACRMSGAILVETPAQAVDLAHLLVGSPLPRGGRTAVVSDSGGQGALAADVLVRNSLTVPHLSDGVAQALADELPAGAAVRNPIDLAGAGERDLSTYARLVELLLRSGEVDSVLLSGYFGSYGADTPALVERELEVVGSLAGAVRDTGRPVVVHSMAPDSLAVQSLRAQAVPALHTIDAAARSLALAVELASRQATLNTLPGPGTRHSVFKVPGRCAGYLAARDLFESYGVRYPPGLPVRDEEQLRRATSELAPPYVLKAAWLEHKTEVGGVVLGLPDAAAVKDAFADLAGQLGPGEYVLEEMDTRDPVVELIVGARVDPSFGPLVLVGLGGVQAEVYRDVQVALAPVDEDEAVAMLGRLRAFPLLRGWRGRPPVDVAAAARTVVAVSRVVAEHRDVIECEINPLRVAPDGAVAVDALVVTGART